MKFPSKTVPIKWNQLKYNDNYIIYTIPENPIAEIVYEDSVYHVMSTWIARKDFRLLIEAQKYIEKEWKMFDIPTKPPRTQAQRYTWKQVHFLSPHLIQY